MGSKDSSTGLPKRRGAEAKTPTAGPGKNSAGEFGREGTNKTIPEPKADNAPSEELGNTPHVGKTPYTRG